MPNIAAILAVLTVAFVLFAAKLTNGASRSTEGPVSAPSLDPQTVADTLGAREQCVVVVGRRDGIVDRHWHGVGTGRTLRDRVVAW